LWPDLQYHPSTALGREKHDTKIETLRTRVMEITTISARKLYNKKITFIPKAILAAK
jgi:hypothetical protein